MYEINSREGVINVKSCINEFDQENRMALIYVERHFYWKEVVELALNNIVRKSLNLNVEDRTARKILEIIGEVWSGISKACFPNLITYYTVLVKMTDHLLLFLAEVCNHLEILVDNENMLLGLDSEKNPITFVYSIRDLEVDTYMERLKHVSSKFIQAPEQLHLICIESGTKYSYSSHTGELQKINVKSLINL